MLKRTFSASDYVTTHKDIEKVLAKSADDLAESIEIMVAEIRPPKDKRATLRGAICRLRGEETKVTHKDAVLVFMDLKGVWAEKRMEHRVLICQRAIEILESNNAS